MRIWPIHLSLLLTSTLLLQATAADAQERTAPIRVLIIDGQNNHNWRATTPVLKEALEKSGRFSVAVSSFLKEGDVKPGAVKETLPFPPDLGKFDVVLSNYNGLPWPVEFQQSFAEHVKSGKIGLVVFHAANNSFTSWPEFNQMIGMGWRNNKFGDGLSMDADGKLIRFEKGSGRGAGETTMHPFQVTVRDAEHPVTKGMPQLWMHTADQLVHGLRGPAENIKCWPRPIPSREKTGPASTS